MLDYNKAHQTVSLRVPHSHACPFLESSISMAQVHPTGKGESEQIHLETLINMETIMQRKTILIYTSVYKQRYEQFI
jgi:hypothetical protein